MTPDQTRSYLEGEHHATRVASCVARLAAIELMNDARWWNRRRRGFMARALLAHAEELEQSAEADAVHAQAG
jgi:hypothetical protein